MKENKNNKGNDFFAILFLISLLGFSGVNVAFNAGEIWEEIADQNWNWSQAQASIKAVENEMGDKLLLQQRAVDLYGGMQRVLGKQETGNFEVLRDKNGFLYNGNFWNFSKDDAQELALRTIRLEQQVTDGGSKFGVILFPENLPASDAEYSGLPYIDSSTQMDLYAAWLQRYGITPLDLRDNWSEVGLSQEEAFFKTDHHWTPLAAFYSYCAILDWMQESYGVQIEKIQDLQNLDNYHITNYENVMLGSHGRAGGMLFAGETEDYSVIYPREEGEYRLNVGTLENYDKYEGSFAEALLSTDYHEGDYKELFEGHAENTYLHAGVTDYASIKNRKPALEEKILLLRDSYCTPIGAFLAQSFEEVDMLWIGEYTQEQLEDYLAENQYDYVFLALYPENISFSFFPFGVDADD